MMTDTVPPIEWRTIKGLSDYRGTLQAMEDRALAIRNEGAAEAIWLLEHPALYTSGTSAKSSDLFNPLNLPVHNAGRGGQFTYHGPGQRVVYVMLDLKRRGADVRRFVHALEEWIIRSLAVFNVQAERREGRVGVWVDRTQPGGPLREDKIAALGIRLKRWVSFHGLSINVEPDLSHFHGITPCGISDPHYGVTSLVDLGRPVTMGDLDVALMSTFAEVFETDGAQLTG